MSRGFPIMSFDHRAVCMNDQRQLLLSGAVHYPRSTPDMWPHLLEESRKAGLNTIETYVFWNLHERRRGTYDFSGRLNLRAFCDEIAAQGLQMILRIGPYICAETNYGGLPAWLRDVPGIQMRTWNAPFQQEMERWVRFLIDYLRPCFADRGGPIILAQLENEYDNISAQYGEAGERYLEWAVTLGQEIGVEIPWLMCSGNPEATSTQTITGVVETINAFYGHHLLEKHVARHPDQPALWTESWTGWYTTYGMPMHRRSPTDLAYAVARFIAEGGTGINYYMWHGGFNFGRDGMYLIASDYSFDAPLDIFGLPTTKSAHLRQLHTSLLTYQDVLLAAERPEQITFGPQCHVFVYQGPHTTLAFLCNDSSDETAQIPFADQSHSLPPQTVRVLADNTLLFDSSHVASQAVITRAWRPVPQVFAPWTTWAEPIPTTNHAYAATIHAERPIEQLQLTQDRSDYCWYATTLATTEVDTGTLTIQGAGDLVAVFVDGQLVSEYPALLREHRGSFDGPAFTQSYSLTLTPGEHDLTVLGIAIGLIKGDWMIGDVNMVNERKGIWGQVRWQDHLLAGHWTMHPGLLGEHAHIYADGAALIPWQPLGSNSSSCQWWRTSFASPTDAPLVALDLRGMTKGLIWLNGHCVGRYWLANSHEEGPIWYTPPVTHDGLHIPSQRYYPLPSAWLRDHNILTLFDEAGGDPSRLTLCRWTPTDEDAQ